MKKVIAITVLLIGLVGYSQRGHQFDNAHRNMKEMTSEQIAILKTKKMTLALDLNSEQQKEIQKINFENVEDRKAMMMERDAKRMDEEHSKPSAKERFDFQNERLDKMIAQKAKMKQILSEDQFEKWERIHQHQRHHRKDRNKEHRGQRGHSK
ncbi:hypothetical protein [uncultured Eudoraea sp.]|uniref:hypothetical protein n=1 Tax=uncultured Eudoraea sp. TaxID=1035614 RepID=UPI002613065B|nr:hypothetical protein [uncultured Eudoraea sp.]